jgi:GWxTD domain-containing protein
MEAINGLRATPLHAGSSRDLAGRDIVGMLSRSDTAQVGSDAAQSQLPRAQSATATNKELYQALPARYQKWLDEDVAYIIELAERNTFLRLSSNSERDKFIEQFWEVRNPNPGFAVNPFKEEHYRRIAYANEHFASDIPGPKTDRGHIYILFGDPDYIERGQRLIDGKSVSYEHWIYANLRGCEQETSPVSFEFRDLRADRMYILSQDPNVPRPGCLNKKP